ncbi:MAG: hypothetical protein ACR2PA_02120 [Hyphomicrobiaceae bacterium]
MSEPLPEVETIYLDDPSVSGAAITSKRRAETLFVYPFRDEGIRASFVINHQTVLFVTRSDRGTLLAKIDVVTGDEIQRVSIGLSGRSYRLTKDRQNLLIFGYGITSVDVVTLELRHRYDFAMFSGTRGRLARNEEYFQLDSRVPDDDKRVFHSKALKQEHSSRLRHSLNPESLQFYETDGGRLVFLNNVARYEIEGTCNEWHLVELDLEAGTIDQLSCKPLQWEDWRRIVLFDGDAKRLVLRADSAIPISDGTSQTEIEEFGHTLPNIQQHPDVVSDGTWRYGVSLEVWSLRDGELQKDSPILARMMTAAELMTERASHLSIEELDEILYLDAFKIANKGDDKLAQRFVTRWDASGGCDQRLVSPYSTSHEGLGATSLAIDPAGDAFWLWFHNDDCLRRVAFDGRIGPLIKFEPEHVRNKGLPTLEFDSSGVVTVKRPELGTYCVKPDELGSEEGPIVLSQPTEPYVEPVSHRAAFVKFIAAQTVTRIVLSTWSRDECAKALGEQTARIRLHFDKLIVGRRSGHMRFEYLVCTETVTEPDFFQRIVDNELDLSLELRKLLTTYLDKIGEGGEGRQPWYSNEIPALGPAMRALVLMDAGSLDILRTYMSKRDGEHEIYCWQEIFPDLIAQHGWCDDTMFSFGIFATLNVNWGGHSGFDRNRYGLLTAASKRYPASKFARMILTEIAKFEARQQWNDQDDSWLLEELCQSLNPEESYQKQLLAELAPHLPI